ncbi:glycosyltransferase [Stenotrophomonas sp.]|uniref:glycosyltransferase n=1 Tax=Stenotrophomonas sp. TaxID=69392 RepID=UPI00289DDB65|nr:glycosyltransferase [Stenotrophomonas sp.]
MRTLASRLYRGLLPRGLRQRLAERRNKRLCESLRFVRTPAWVLDAPIEVSLNREAGSVAGQGVNVLGYLRGQFGLGVSARAYTRALLEVGYPVSLNDARVAVPHANADHSLDAHLESAPRAPFDTTLVFVNPDHFREAMDALGSSARPRRLVACWFWELPRAPDAWREAVDAVDEIIVATDFVGDAFRAVTSKPVTRIPFPLLDIQPSGLTRRDAGLPDDAFVFLCTFDCNSSVDRKNPGAVIRAFRTAFPASRQDVCLLIKSSNGHRNPEALRSLLALAEADPRVLIRDDVIDARHLQALQGLCDAYVSLHRAEGLGLGMAECMRLGKPVIATGWSGNLDFMNESNSLLVNYTLVPVQPGQYPHAEGQVWAEPDPAHAAELMLRVVDRPESMVDRIARARGDIEQGMSLQRSGALLASYLDGNTPLAASVHSHGRGLSGAEIQ